MHKTTSAETLLAALGFALLLLTACEPQHVRAPAPPQAAKLADDPAAIDTGPPEPAPPDTNAAERKYPLGLTGGLAHHYPVAYRRYLAELPRSLASLGWLRHLDEDLSSPIESVTVGGRATLKGSSCIPHDCGANYIDLLFSPDQSHVVGMVHLGNEKVRLITIGKPSSAEMACLQRFPMQSNLEPTCPQAHP